jgi:hypothetical protein
LNDQLGLGGKADIHQTASQSLVSQFRCRGHNQEEWCDTFFLPSVLNSLKLFESIEGSCVDPLPEVIHSIYDVLLISEVEFHLVEAKKWNESVSFDDIGMDSSNGDETCHRDHS